MIIYFLLYYYFDNKKDHGRKIISTSEDKNNDKPWRKFIKKHQLWKYDFFNRSPNPNVHIGKFIKYVILYPYYYLSRKIKINHNII